MRYDFIFWLAMAFFAGHELDAVAQHEWRLLPLLNLLNDEDGQIAFVLLHIPFFAGLFWAAGHEAGPIRLRSRLAFDIYLVVHAGVHFALSGHALYTFEAPVETITVYGGAATATAHMLLVRLGERPLRVS